MTISGVSTSATRRTSAQTSGPMPSAGQEEQGLCHHSSPRPRPGPRSGREPFAAHGAGLRRGDALREHPPRRLQMRRIDHLAVELQYARVRLRLERGDDRTRLRDLRLPGRERTIDHRHLRGMYCHHPGKPVAPSARRIGAQSVEVAKIGIDRLDRYHARRMRAEQRQAARKLIRGGIAPVSLPRRQRADGGG